MNPLRAILSYRASRLQLKVLAIVAAAMAVAVAVALVALTRVYGTAKELERISREDFEMQLSIQRTSIALKAQTREWQNVLLRGKDPAKLQKHWDQFVAQEKVADDFAAQARDADDNKEIRASLDRFVAVHKEMGARYRAALEAFRAAQFDPAAGDAAASDLDAGAAAALEEAEQLAQEDGSRSISEAVASGARAYRIAIAAILVAVAASLVGLWLFMRRGVIAPIVAAGGYAERIARGDLTADIRGGSRDEAGQLLATLARMNAGLAQVVSQVRSGAESVVSASGQVAAGTTDLSQRTEEQASSLEETAASMEQLSGTVRQNAENARQADELALNASKRAEQGGREVARVVVTMSEISASARRIADIISVIDGIAFQTNILALNAAVEAARAGEQGRGFAVVASEVRSLAQRSGQAAKEIRDLIGESVGQVDNGTKLVDQAGSTIAALVGDVKRVSGLMRSIAEASAEQSRGVQQVNKTVTEMDKVVQQNAAAVQESAAAAEAMRRQAEALLHAVGAFRLAQARPAAPAMAAPDAAAPQPIARTTAAAAPAAAPSAARTAIADGPGDEWEEF